MNILEHLYQHKIIPLQLWGIDVSITNGILTMWLALVLVFLFFYLGSRRPKLVPRGLQNLAEMFITFTRDEIASQIEGNSEKWLPFLVTIFAFILFNNLLGLIPGMGGSTTNINVTAALAIIVFVTVQAAGIYHLGITGYLKKYIPEGVPFFIVIFMIPVEIVSQLARPFSLAVRLFANMFAGHAVMLLLISMIFIFRSYILLPIPVLGNTAFLAFELFIAAIQAFVFTYLSAFYIATALEEEH
jgi:F-type H+-transporting ATPase subunit a